MVLGHHPVIRQLCFPILQLLRPRPCKRCTSFSVTASGQQLRKASIRSRPAVAVEEQFDTWIAANSLPGVSKASLDPFEAPASAPPASAAPASKSAAVLDARLVRRLHFSVSRSLIRELLQNHELRWSPQQRVFLCTPRQECAVVYDSPGADSDSDGSPSQAQVVTPCRPSIARGATNAAIRAAASRCASLKLPPLQMPAVDVSASDADALIWQLAQLGSSDASCLVVLLSADSAALGLWRDGELVRHKVLAGYTVRKSQGTSQLKQMRNNLGRQSVGGAIRARETRRFFQSVAIRLSEWSADVKDCQHLWFSGSVRPWNEVFACTSPACRIDRHDKRWRKLPLSIRRPRFTDMERAVEYLSYGELILKPNDRSDRSTDQEIFL